MLLTQYMEAFAIKHAHAKMHSDIREFREVVGDHSKRFLAMMETIAEERQNHGEAIDNLNNAVAQNECLMDDSIEWRTNCAQKLQSTKEDLDDKLKTHDAESGGIGLSSHSEKVQDMMGAFLQRFRGMGILVQK